MPIVRAMVLLFAFPAGQKLSVRGDQLWYRNYFFGPVYGQAGYWMKQTSYQLVLDGEVRDWVSVDTPNPNLMNRTVVLNDAIRSMEQGYGVDFNPFDIVILVIGAPANVGSDGGSTQVRSKDRNHAGIVIRTGDRFDFVAHELGHAFGLNHSYGNWTYKNSSWSQPGEYGHPYCVMSAQGYGGIGQPFFPAEPRDGRPEYSGLGPSLNAGTALERGWLDAYVHQLPGVQTKYELRSRHWLGKSPGSTPQALEVRGVDGKTYVVEYRENDMWDAGQGAPALIINAMRGSSADLAHPNTQSATYLGMIRLPLNFGGQDSVFNGPGFGIEVLEGYPWKSSLRIRLRPGRVEPTPVVLVHNKETLNAQVIEEGSTSFERGMKLCVEGTWPYKKRMRREVATFEATFALAVPPVQVSWMVDGIELTSASDTLRLPFRSVKIANPKLEDRRGTRQLDVHYEIQSIPNGSRLRLFNQPDDETYTLSVRASLSTALGSGSQVSQVEFIGVDYQYPDEFYQERSECLRELIDIGRRYVRYKVLLEPDLWQRIPAYLEPRVNQLLALLGQLREQGEELSYKQMVNDLAELIGEAELSPLVFAQDERVVLPPVVVVQERELGEELPRIGMGFFDRLFHFFRGVVNKLRGR